MNRNLDEVILNSRLDIVVKYKRNTRCKSAEEKVLKKSKNLYAKTDW